MWSKAVSLAKKFNRPELNELVSTYVRDLLGRNMIIQAIQLYYEVNKLLEAAKLIVKVISTRLITYTFIKYVIIMTK